MIIKPEDLKELSHLEFFAKQVVEGFITGLHKSPFHGFSVEFAEHRIYNPGESTKHIDWKLYGRSDKLFIKRYEEETNLRCQLVIDASLSMYYPVDAKTGAENQNNKIRMKKRSGDLKVHGACTVGRATRWTRLGKVSDDVAAD